MVPVSIPYIEISPSRRYAGYACPAAHFRKNHVTAAPAATVRIKGTQRPEISSILMEAIPAVIIRSKKRPERRLSR